MSPRWSACGPHYVRRLFKGDLAATVEQLEQYAAALGFEFNVYLTRIPRGR